MERKGKIRVRKCAQRKRILPKHSKRSKRKSIKVWGPLSRLSLPFCQYTLHHQYSQLTPRQWHQSYRRGGKTLGRPMRHLDSSVEVRLATPKISKMTKEERHCAGVSAIWNKEDKRTKGVVLHIIYISYATEHSLFVCCNNPVGQRQSSRNKNRQAAITFLQLWTLPSTGWSGSANLSRQKQSNWESKVC